MQGGKVCLCLSACLILTGLSADVLHVTPDGSGDGSDWASATSLTNALAIAGSGGEIWLAAGAYEIPVASGAGLVLPSAVALYGGFAGNETARAARPSDGCSTLTWTSTTPADALVSVTAASGTVVLDRLAVSNIETCALKATGGARIELTDCRFENIGSRTTTKYAATYHAPFYVVRSEGSPLAATRCTFLGNRVKGNSTTGGHIVSLTGAAGGSSFTDCTWKGNDVIHDYGTCYTKLTAATGASSAAKPEHKAGVALSNYAVSGACVVDLSSDAAEVIFSGCTFAYNVTAFGWTAGLCANRGVAKVRESYFWANVINARWGVAADVFVGHRGTADLDRSLLAARTAPYVDPTNARMVLGDAMKYGDPGLLPSVADFIANDLSFYASTIQCDASTFPTANTTRWCINTYTDPGKGDEAYVCLKAGVTFPESTPTMANAVVSPVPAEELPALGIKPVLVPQYKSLKPAAGWKAHYAFDNPCSANSYTNAEGVARAVYWYRHLDVPAWGRVADPQATEKGSLDPDWFATMKPVDGEVENRPLIVFLHGRGGGMNGFSVHAQQMVNEDAVYHTPDDFYGLMLDCREAWANDFWWGAMPPAKDATKTGSYDGYYCFLGGGQMSGELNAGPKDGDFTTHPTRCLDWCLQGETPAAKRVMETIEWMVRRYKIDRNRIYLAGNSMGGQGTLAIGLTHGDVFAAINANVPATIWYPAARMGFIDREGKDVAAADYVPPAYDPPVCFDWSGSDDAWSRDHDVMYRNMNRFRFNYTGWWGNYGHCGSLATARGTNDLVMANDWLSIRKDRAYLVFANATGNSSLPWPQQAWSAADATGGASSGGIEAAAGGLVAREGGDLVGQWNAWFRYEVVEDSETSFAVDLWLASEEELPSAQFVRPQSLTADISPRRLQKFPHAKDMTANWSYGDGSGGTVTFDDHLGVYTVTSLPVTGARRRLTLTLGRITRPIATAEVGTTGLAAAPLTVSIAALGDEATSATVKVRYGTAPDALTQEKSLGTVTATGDYSYVLDGLTHSTTYYAKLVLDNGNTDGQTVLDLGSFTTQVYHEPAPPALGPVSVTVADSGTEAAVTVAITTFDTEGPGTLTLAVNGTVVRTWSGIIATGTYADTVAVRRGQSNSFVFTLNDGRLETTSAGSCFATTLTDWFSVTLAAPGEVSAEDWTSDAATSSPTGSFAKPREDTVAFTPAQASESGADAVVRGKLKVSVFTTPPEVPTTAQAAICFVSGSGVTAKGWANGTWHAIGSGYSKGALVDYVARFDYASAEAPRVRYTVGDQSSSWLALGTAARQLTRIDHLGTFGSFSGSYYSRLSGETPIEIVPPVIAGENGASGLAFGVAPSGTATFSMTVSNPVKGAYYTVFTSASLTGTFTAETVVSCADASTALALTVSADGPSKFAVVVASTEPFALGDELPKEGGVQ